jgi:hypothetical protein
MGGGEAPRRRYSAPAKVASLKSLAELRASVCDLRRRRHPDWFGPIEVPIGHFLSTVRVGSGPMSEELGQKHTSRDDREA